MIKNEVHRIQCIGKAGYDTTPTLEEFAELFDIITVIEPGQAPRLRLVPRKPEKKT